MLLVIAGGLTILSIHSLYNEKDSNKYYMFSLLLAGAISIFFANIFYLKEDSNFHIIIMSKFLIEAQFLLPLVIVMMIFNIIPSSTGIKRDILITIYSIVLLPCFVFCFLGTYNNCNKFQVIPGLIPNLSGENHLLRFHSTDYQAIQWIKENIYIRSIILEANQVGEEYSGRLSAYSGRKTVLGWKHTQELAYGINNTSIMKNINERLTDIDKIYSEADKNKVLNLIKKYNIKYICIGELERKIYPQESLQGFDQIGLKVFQSGGENPSEIYELER